jgi:RNA polymerase sigma-70 factor (ECF subfamily)
VQHNILDLYDHKKVRINYIAAFKDFYNRGENVTDNQVRENELKRLIEKEIANLPTKMRTIFEMSRKQYLTHQQIADRIGVSEGTVRNQVYNALIKLRSRLSCMFFLQLMSTILWFNRL